MRATGGIYLAAPKCLSPSQQMPQSSTTGSKEMTIHVVAVTTAEQFQHSRQKILPAGERLCELGL